MTPNDKLNTNAGHEVEYFFDDEPEHTCERELSANEILRRGGVDSTNHYLKSLDPPESFEGRGEDLVKIRKGRRFVSIAKVPTPVS